VRLLALGDSLTAGYGLPQGQGFVPRLQAALAERGRAVQVIDAGVSGDTTAGGLARLDWALAENPQAAIVALGGNDGLRGLPPTQSRARPPAVVSPETPPSSTRTAWPPRRSSAACSRGTKPWPGGRP